MTQNRTPEADETQPEGFGRLGLAETLTRAVEAAGYSHPTPIQREAIPAVLDGRDVLGCAQTGTGKTAAFALPILHHLLGEKPRRSYPIRALVLAPTRELAAQIGDNFVKYAKNTRLRSAVVFGGVGKDPQVRKLRRGVDVLVATPGRLLDLQQEGEVDLGEVSFLVLDEADRMLDMGFIHDVRRVVRQVPEDRRTLLFSATMPKEVRKLAEALLDDPLPIAVDPVSSTREPISQSVYFITKRRKTDLLIELLREEPIDNALVFTRTRYGADRLQRKLYRAKIKSAALHGDKSQGQRERALSQFKDGRLRVVVATDIAARGIDVKELSHVVNFDLPNDPESYVHRVGRTGRAGKSGIAISFCCADEREYLRDIERLTKRTLERPDLPESMQQWASDPEATTEGNAPAKKSSNSSSSRGRRDERKPGRSGSRDAARRDSSTRRPRRSPDRQGESRDRRDSSDSRSSWGRSRPARQGGGRDRRDGGRSEGSRSSWGQSKPGRQNDSRDRRDGGRSEGTRSSWGQPKGRQADARDRRDGGRGEGTRSSWGQPKQGRQGDARDRRDGGRGDDKRTRGERSSREGSNQRRPSRDPRERSRQEGSSRWDSRPGGDKSRRGSGPRRGRRPNAGPKGSSDERSSTPRGKTSFEKRLDSRPKDSKTPPPRKPRRPRRPPN